MNRTISTLLLAVLAAGCDSDSPTAPDMGGALTLRLDGVEPLGEGFTYEGWILVNGAPISTGTFAVDASGTASQTSFEVDAAALASATKFILTIEPSPDPDPSPSATHYLAGDFDGTAAALSVADGAALGDSFAGADGRFILETPSSAGDPADYASGIWWLDPAGGPGPGLTLPTLPEGWVYEGWVVGPDGAMTTGRFNDVMAGDSDGAGPAAGPDGFPPFPGQDFVNPRSVLTGYAAVISVEPDPDDSPSPFTLKPLVDENIEDVGAATVQPMSNAAGSFPSGTASR